MIPPDLLLERELLEGVTCVAGIDEVGRGALAGPVSVGVVVVDAHTGSIPPGLTDSKLLTAAAREALVPRIRAWCLAAAVGHAEAVEVDAHGIVAALRLACLRALAQLPMEPPRAILDGSHDWLTRVPDLFEPAVPTPAVRMRVKADTSCASVAAASVLAKVERDAIMRDLDRTFPGYGLAGHKGYGSSEHRAAIAELGPSQVHRRSWRLV